MVYKTNQTRLYEEVFFVQLLEDLRVTQVGVCSLFAYLYFREMFGQHKNLRRVAAFIVTSLHKAFISQSTCALSITLEPLLGNILDYEFVLWDP